MSENPSAMNPPHDGLDDDWAAAMHEIAAREVTPAAGAPAPPPLPGGRGPAALPALTATQDLEFLLQVGVTLSAELGRRKLPIRELLTFTPGTVIDLDTHSGEPIQVLVNGTPIAKGDIVVINDQLGIRLTDIISPGERLGQITP